jgi:hypothetical protein
VEDADSHPVSFTTGNFPVQLCKQTTIYEQFQQTSLIALLAGALSIAFIAHFIRFDLIVQPRKDFYNELWGPAHLLVRGESPYDTSSLNADLPAVWPPMAIGVFAPLGWLSEKTASRLAFTCSSTN